MGYMKDQVQAKPSDLPRTGVSSYDNDIQRYNDLLPSGRWNMITFDLTDRSPACLSIDMRIYYRALELLNDNPRMMLVDAVHHAVNQMMPYPEPGLYSGQSWLYRDAAEKQAGTCQHRVVAFVRGMYHLGDDRWRVRHVPGSDFGDNVTSSHVISERLSDTGYGYWNPENNSPGPLVDVLTQKTMAQTFPSILRPGNAVWVNLKAFWE